MVVIGQNLVAYIEQADYAVEDPTASFTENANVIQQSTTLCS